MAGAFDKLHRYQDGAEASTINLCATSHNDHSSTDEQDLYLQKCLKIRRIRIVRKPPARRKPFAQLRIKTGGGSGPQHQDGVLWACLSGCSNVDPLG